MVVEEKQQGKVIASLSDEGCKVMGWPQQNALGKRFIIIQHPSGIKFWVQEPENDTLFEPWMIDYIIHDCFGEGETASQCKCIKVAREYFYLWWEELTKDTGKDGCNITFKSFSDEFGGFYSGYMAALTGKVEII